MTPTSHPPKSLKFLAAAVAAASLVSCSSGGSEPRADTKSSPGAVSGDQATDATTVEDATATTADDATDTTAGDAASDSPTTDPGPDPGEEPEVLGSSSGAHPADPNDATSVPLRVDVVGVQRQPGDAVEVRFVITNDSADATFEPYTTLSDGAVGGAYDVGGAALVDLTGDKRYLPLRDSEGVCLCTGVNNVEIAPGMSLDVYVQFPAPPDDVATIDFTFPGFAPVNGVEIR